MSSFGSSFGSGYKDSVDRPLDPASMRQGLGPARTRVISITSGKGGVGKTTLLSNIALQLGNDGKRVLILDGDMGMANVDIMFNVRAQKSIHDIISGEASVRDVMIDVAKNVTLIPGGSGIFQLQDLSVYEKQALLHEVSGLGQEYDVMLIDTAPGIHSNVLYLNSAAQEICVVVTPEPASVADSYALIKVLHQKSRENRFSIICNQVRDEADGRRLFEKMDAIAQKFLCVSLDYKGSVPTDLNLRQATRSQQLVTRASPSAPSSLAIRKLAQKLKGYEVPQTCKGGLQFFWEQLIGVA